MNIKDRLTIEIEIAKKRSFTDQLREMELSKSYSKGEAAYYQWRIDDLINEMTKKKGIADNWVLNGRFDINHKDWIEQFIEANLNEPEIWNEVQTFLRQYFRLIEYKEKHHDLHDKSFKTSVWAWYYCILIKAHPLLAFNTKTYPEGITEGMKKIAQDKGVSVQGFRGTYYKISKEKSSEIPSVRIIKKVIELLKNDPEASIIAQGYLDKAN